MNWCGRILAAFWPQLEIRSLQHLDVVFPIYQLNVGNSKLKAGQCGRFILRQSCSVDDFPKKDITNISLIWSIYSTYVSSLRYRWKRWRRLRMVSLNGCKTTSGE